MRVVSQHQIVVAQAPHAVADKIHLLSIQSSWRQEVDHRLQLPRTLRLDDCRHARARLGSGLVRAAWLQRLAHLEEPIGERTIPGEADRVEPWHHVQHISDLEVSVDFLLLRPSHGNANGPPRVANIRGASRATLQTPQLPHLATRLPDGEPVVLRELPRTDHGGERCAHAFLP
eukprot:CAMPEP_0182839680 /NCGR_PEP_ID=MMETSP0006_2-20121128/23998_1 /TAXON_ID=97485 /ORGANISM="Prymnesium parvum, Strain Texoma1" /LENGTH=173 /DNA_ID=CAMNT_0024968851 /DNA_START=495 /DNA_END=1016 /DNA_ORIENTATION=+